MKDIYLKTGIILFVIVVALFIIIPTCSAEIKALVIEHPGVMGVNSYFGDGFLAKNEARQIVNFDIVDGDLVKRPGYTKVYVGSDTLCDGIFPYYDIDGSARLLKVTYDNDSGVISYSDPNTYTFTAGSTIVLRQYIDPFFGYDWVQFFDAAFGVNGKSHPVIYMKDQWGTLSIPTPGAPMVSVLNVAGNVTGAVSYRLHYIVPSDTALKSNPGPVSAYVFPSSNKVALWAFPEKTDLTDWDTVTVLITRTKDGGSKYYVVDTQTYSMSLDTIYIDNIAEGSLGDEVPDSLDFQDSMLTPGAFNINITAGAWGTDVLGAGSDIDSFYMAYSYYDSNLRIESEISPWAKREPNGNSGITDFTMHIPLWGRNFIDGIIVYCSYQAGVANGDSTPFRPFDTNFVNIMAPSDSLIRNCSEKGFTDDGNGGGATDIDSAEFFGRNYWPYPLANRIPYKYMVHSYNRLWAAGDEDYPSRLYYSGRTDTNALGYWDMTFDYLALDENDGDKIMGLVADANGVIAYKGHSIWFITGTDPQYDMRLLKIVGGIGAVSNNAIARMGNVDCFLSVDGEVCRRSGMKVDTISQKVRDSFEGLGIDSLSKAVMTVYEGELWLRVNDTTFICNFDGQPRWRKYSLSPRYFAEYDTTTSSDYAKKPDLIFTNSTYDSIFAFNFNNSATTDNGDSIAVLVKLGIFLEGINFKILGGVIEAEIPSEDTIWMRLLAADGDTLSKIFLENDGKHIDDKYMFGFASSAGEKFHIVILDNGSCATLKIKKLTIFYREYARNI